LQRLKQAILNQLLLLFLLAFFLAEAVLMPRLFGLFRLAKPVINLRYQVKGLRVSTIESSRGVEVRKGARRLAGLIPPASTRRDSTMQKTRSFPGLAGDK